jgi:sulfur relay (sulfurtransferase) DsrC/TusE family protein
MTQLINNAQDCETSSHHIRIRLTELKEQHWDRNKSEGLAHNEAIAIKDEHWAVIV